MWTNDRIKERMKWKKWKIYEYYTWKDRRQRGRKKGRYVDGWGRWTIWLRTNAYNVWTCVIMSFTLNHYKMTEICTQTHISHSLFLFTCHLMLCNTGSMQCNATQCGRNPTTTTPRPHTVYMTHFQSWNSVIFKPNILHVNTPFYRARVFNKTTTLYTFVCQVHECECKLALKLPSLQSFKFHFHLALSLFPCSFLSLSDYLLSLLARIFGFKYVIHLCALVEWFIFAIFQPWIRQHTLIYGKMMGHFWFGNKKSKREKKNSVGIIFKFFMQIHVIPERRLSESGRERDRVQSVCKPAEQAMVSISFARSITHSHTQAMGRIT